MKLHLEFGGQLWCDDAQDHEGTTEDPRDATCSDCLKRASSYGAATAMRYAAVEAGVTQDPELVRERDEAIRRLEAIGDALEGREAFFCTDCLKLHHVSNRGLDTGKLSWCKGCAPHGVRA